MEILSFDNKRHARKPVVYNEDVRETFARFIAGENVVPLRKDALYTPEAPEDARRDIESFRTLAREIKSEDSLI